MMKFFSRPSPKAGRELQTVSNTRRRMRDGGPLASRSRSPGHESTQRLCTCFSCDKQEPVFNQGKQLVLFNVKIPQKMWNGCEAQGKHLIR